MGWKFVGKNEYRLVDICADERGEIGNMYEVGHRMRVVGFGYVVCIDSSI